MIGRAMLGRPWIFKDLEGGKAQTEIDLYTIILEHFDLTLEYYVDKTAVPLFRKHAAWYSTGMPRAAEFRIAINRATSAADVKKLISDFFN